jgi:putative hydrolase of the HAD superfamily
VDPAAETVLGALARDHRLALVTNGAPDVQREKLAGTTLARYFGAIVISCEVEVAKPDPRIFEIALDRIGASAADAVMVGDSLARDVAGARAAGIRVVWIDRQLSLDEKGPAPDARIESLSALPVALAAWAPPASSARGSRAPRPG